MFVFSCVLPVQGLVWMARISPEGSSYVPSLLLPIEVNILVNKLGALQLTPGLWLSQEPLASLLEPWRIVTSRG